jgi:hypothetical protein
MVQGRDEEDEGKKAPTMLLNTLLTICEGTSGREYARLRHQGRNERSSGDLNRQVRFRDIERYQESTGFHGMDDGN